MQSQESKLPFGFQKCKAVRCESFIMRYKEKKTVILVCQRQLQNPRKDLFSEWGFVRFQSISVLACSDVSLLIVDLIIKSLA